MYKHEIDSALNEGSPVRRLSWDKHERLVKLRKDITLDLDAREQKDLGVAKGMKGTIAAGTLVKVSQYGVEVGYVPTYEDLNHQDWEVVKAGK